MADKNRVTETSDKRFCAHANCKVTLKTSYIFPADILPETPPRLHQRQCSHYLVCNLQDKAACTFSVTQVRKGPIKMEHSI